MARKKKPNPLTQVTPERLDEIRIKTGKKLTLRQKKLLLSLPHAKTLSEAGELAGYSPKNPAQSAHQALHKTNIATYIENLGLVGLVTLEEVATKGKNEIARVNAATKLVEQAYGKPTEQKTEVGNILIQINKI